MQISSATASQTKDEFLQLLVTQLQNQDPLEPVKQEDFLAQLAQFSTLEKVEEMNSTLETQVELQRELMATDRLATVVEFVGREVTYKHDVVSSDDETGETTTQETRTGTVDRVKLINGEVRLIIGGDEVALDRIAEFGPSGAVSETSASETSAEQTDEQTDESSSPPVETPPTKRPSTKDPLIEATASQSAK